MATRHTLVKARKRAGNLSQTQVAHLVGVHVNTYGLIERGDADPTIGTAFRIARVLKSSVPRLFPDLTESATPR